MVVMGLDPQSNSNQAGARDGGARRRDRFFHAFHGRFTNNGFVSAPHRVMVNGVQGGLDVVA